MSKKIEIIREGITEKYHGIAPIANFIFNETNQKMYGKYEEDHILNLQLSIIKDGLKNPIVVYSDGKTLKSGHNRLSALLKAGIKEPPTVAKILSNT